MTVFFDNRRLLEAFRRGEREALTTVYQRYVDDVARLARYGFALDSGRGAIRGIREFDRQHDLVQEAFVRCFSERARQSFDGVSPFRPYLMRIAKNLMIDEARKAGRFVDMTERASAGPDSTGPEILSPEDDLEWRTLREATRAYCATLSVTLQRFVKLRFVEEQSQRDVADALGVTRRKVRTWEREVRQDLRRHLEQLTLRGSPVEQVTPGAPEPPASDGIACGPTAGLVRK